MVSVLQRDLADAAIDKKARDAMMLIICGGAPSKVDSWLSEGAIRKWFVVSC